MASMLLFLLIFLIPSNLALHLDNFQFSIFNFQFLVDGILVDYLLPKLYLTDILVLLLVVPWLFRHLRSTIYNLRSSPLVLFFLWSLVLVPFAPRPLPSFWFWLKLIEMSLFVVYLRSTIYHLRSIIYPALSLCVVFQSLLALIQFVTQRHVFPYWLLGESQFSSLTPGIATASFFGILKVLPLGTTPHPNVLAGFTAVSLVSLWLISPKKTISHYITAIFGLTTLIITQSLSAVLSLGVGVLLIATTTKISTRTKLLLIPLVLLAFTALLVTFSPNLQATSVSRRTKLTAIAFDIVKNNPLGVGLNNFTAVMSDYGDVEASTRFLQPVHNIYFLLWSETGLIGFVLVIWLLRQFLKIENFKLKIPALMLLFIGLADHYPLTLQTGQLLFALSLTLIYLPYDRPIHR